MISKKLHSDFKFGFEFEGFAKIENFLGNIFDYNYNINSWDELECNNLYERDISHFYNNVNSFINNYFNSTKGKTHYDGSVKNFHNGYQSFEYSSPVFSFTPKNIKKIKDFFNNMESNGFGVNNTCGFHTHISFPQISEEDAIWIISQIAIDENKSSEFCFLKTKDSVINFYSDRYANKEFLDSIRNAINNKKYESVASFINDEKYRVLRIHPQGTIEWRGPRNFLNIENGISLYIDKLTNVINILSSSLNKKDINGIPKNEFFNRIKRKEIYFNGLNYPSDCKYILRNGKTGLINHFGNIKEAGNVNNISAKIAESVIKNPVKLLNKDYLPIFDIILNKLKYLNKFSEVINCISKNINYNMIPIDVKIRLIRNIPSCINILNKDEFKYLTSLDIFNWLESIHIPATYDESVSKNIEYVMSNIDKDLLLNCATTFICNASWTIKSIMNVIKNGVFKNIDIKDIYIRYCKSYSIAINNNFTKSFVYKPEELHNELKNYMKQGLIKDITNDDDFGETYTSSPYSEFPSFFILDSYQDLFSKITLSENFVLTSCSSDNIEENQSQPCNECADECTLDYSNCTV